MFKNTEGSLNVHSAGNSVGESKRLTSTFSSTLHLFGNAGHPLFCGGTQQD